MTKRLKPQEIFPGMLVGLDARDYSKFLGEDISAVVGVVVKAVSKKRYRVAWTTGIVEEVWIWQLKKRSQH